jgi:hypothetical protein
MTPVKSPFSGLPFFRELRQGYRALTIYHKLWPYLVNRLWAGPRLARLAGPLDRPVDTAAYSIHLLCSHRDRLGMLWALASWQAVAGESAQVYIHEDGTFTAGDRAVIGRLFPRAQLVDHRDATRRALTTWLADTPAARMFRQNSARVYAVKLMDPYFVSPAEGVLVMDTDILWFKTPDELEDRIRQYQGAVFWPSSGKPSRQMFRDGGELRLDLAALNSGIVYFEKTAFRLDVLEEYCQQLDPGAMLLDQPAYAYVLGQYSPLANLPVEHYHIHKAAHAGTVGKHYSGPRREQFWFEGVELLKGRLLGR